MGTFIAILIVFSPLIYLILTFINDSISDKVKESKHKKHYSEEVISRFTTYQSDINEAYKTLKPLAA